MSTYTHLTNDELYRIARDADGALIAELSERFINAAHEAERLEERVEELQEELEQANDKEAEAHDALLKIREVLDSVV